MKSALKGFVGLLMLAGLMAMMMPVGGDSVGKGGIALEDKIGGVSVVSPANKVDDSWVESVKQINAEWVAILPYGFSYQNSTQLSYNLGRQWWGERIEGMTEIIRHAKGKGLKVMLKPMVWIPGGWPGDYDFATEAEWKEWEKSYSNFILETARIAKREDVDMFCIGTEFKIAVQKREAYWRGLTKSVREIFDGPLTYAANWDNFHRVKFWDELDYIGIDAYFPLSPKTTASVQDLKRMWSTPARSVETLHKLYRKPVLFTEFGYRSLDRCTWKQWEIQKVPYDEQVNLKGQQNAYQAFFESFWEKDWFAGMFLWQWYTNDARAGGLKNSDYTPQNKPAEQLIASWFGK